MTEGRAGGLPWDPVVPAASFTALLQSRGLGPAVVSAGRGRVTRSP